VLVTAYTVLITLVLGFEIQA